MLRTGMLALQLLPSNCLAGIVIITDGCTDVYSTETAIRSRLNKIHFSGDSTVLILLKNLLGNIFQQNIGKKIIKTAFLLLLGITDNIQKKYFSHLITDYF